MKVTTSDDSFQSYIGQFVDVEVNGVVKKFFVQEINKFNTIENAGILKRDTYEILNVSSEQECNQCDGPFPSVYSFYFLAPFGSPTIDPFIPNSKFDVYINDNKVGSFRPFKELNIFIASTALSLTINDEDLWVCKGTNAWYSPSGYFCNDPINQSNNTILNGFNVTAVNTMFFDPNILNFGTNTMLIKRPKEFWENAGGAWFEDLAAYNPAQVWKPWNEFPLPDQGRLIFGRRGPPNGQGAFEVIFDDLSAGPGFIFGPTEIFWKNIEGTLDCSLAKICNFNYDPFGDNRRMQYVSETEVGLYIPFEYNGPNFIAGCVPTPTPDIPTPTPTPPVPTPTPTPSIPFPTPTMPPSPTPSPGLPTPTPSPSVPLPTPSIPIPTPTPDVPTPTPSMNAPTPTPDPTFVPPTPTPGMPTPTPNPTPTPPVPTPTPIPPTPTPPP